MAVLLQALSVRLSYYTLTFTYPLSCATWHFQNVVPILCHVLHHIRFGLKWAILCHSWYDKLLSVI